MAKPAKVSPRSVWALSEHWLQLVDKGEMTRPTGAQYSTACRTVPSVLHGWRDMDIYDIDIEETVAQFRRKYKGELAPSTLDTYASIFDRAVRSYRRYLEDPERWEPPVSRRSRARTRVVQDEAADGEVEAAGTELRRYPIRLTSGQTAELMVPAKLSETDAELLSNVVTAYAKSLVT